MHFPLLERMMMVALSDPIAAALMEYGSATLHEAVGDGSAIDSAIRPLDPAIRMAGTALTVETAPGDNLAIHHALAQAQPGQILVVDSKGYEGVGSWGEIMTLAAQHAGLVGLAIDGCVRDSAAIIASGFPVFARGLCIRGAQKCRPGRINLPIAFGGTAVAPGDIIVGDQDGVVVIPAAQLRLALDRAAQREAKERMLKERIAEGATTLELLGLSSPLAT